VSVIGSTVSGVTPTVTPPRGSRVGAVVALVMGLLLLVPGGLLTALGTSGLIAEARRDDTGFVSSRTAQLSSSSAAVTLSDLDLDLDAEATAWIPERLREVRLRATSTDDEDVFIGIAPQAEVDAWLGPVAHDEIGTIQRGTVDYRRHDGRPDAGSPSDQTFWVASAEGTSTNEVIWPVENGRWAVVVAGADGAPGVAAAVDVSIRAPDLTAASAGVLAFGLVLLTTAIGLVIFGAVEWRRRAIRSPHE